MAIARMTKEERTVAASAPGKPIEIRRYTIQRYDKGAIGAPRVMRISLSDVGRGFMAWPSAPILL